jgi:hypothetical protein
MKLTVSNEWVVIEEVNSGKQWGNSVALSYQEAEELLVKLNDILYPPVPASEVIQINAGDTVSVPVQAKVNSRTIENGKTVNYFVTLNVQDTHITYNPEAVTLVKKNNYKVIVRETLT